MLVLSLTEKEAPASERRAAPQPTTAALAVRVESDVNQVRTEVTKTMSYSNSDEEFDTTRAGFLIPKNKS